MIPLGRASHPPPAKYRRRAIRSRVANTKPLLFRRTAWSGAGSSVADQTATPASAAISIPCPSSDDQQIVRSVTFVTRSKAVPVSSEQKISLCHREYRRRLAGKKLSVSDNVVG